GANFTAGQVYFPDALVSDKSIFRVSQVLTTTNPGSGNASPLTFNGIFEVLIDFTLEGSGPKNFRDGIIGTSTLTLLTGSGTVTFTGSTPILGGPDLKINTQKQLNLNSGMTVPAGANVKIISTSSVEKGAGGILIVEGTLDITDVAISNTSGSILINGTL